MPVIGKDGIKRVTANAALITQMTTTALMTLLSVTIELYCKEYAMQMYLSTVIEARFKQHECTKKDAKQLGMAGGMFVKERLSPVVMAQTLIAEWYD